MVNIYGSSDDLIEVAGAIHEEFYPHGSGDVDYLSFSDGTVLSVEYGKGGFWRINRISVGSAAYRKTEGDDPNDNYSDQVYLDGNIEWVVYGSEFKRKINKNGGK